MDRGNLHIIALQRFTKGLTLNISHGGNPHLLRNGFDDILINQSVGLQVCDLPQRLVPR